MTESRDRPSSRPARLWRLEIVRESRDGVRILAISGRIGVDAAALVARAIGDELHSGQTRLLVDLADVDYVSSAGLAALRNAGELATQGGRQMALCNLSEPVRLVFDLAGLTRHFTILPSSEAGVARLRTDVPRR